MYKPLQPKNIFLYVFTPKTCHKLFLVKKLVIFINFLLLLWQFFLQNIILTVEKNIII